MRQWENSIAVWPVHKGPRKICISINQNEAKPIKSAKPHHANTLFLLGKGWVFKPFNNYCLSFMKWKKTTQMSEATLSRQSFMSWVFSGSPKKAATMPSGPFLTIPRGGGQASDGQKHTAGWKKTVTLPVVD